MSDVAATVADAAGASLRVRRGAGGSLASAWPRRAPAAWILSDGGDPVGARFGLAPRAADTVFRLWWNRSDEILEAPDAAHHGTHICFFADAVTDDVRRRLDVAVLPYAFAPVRPSTSTADGRLGVTYAGEVDISDRALEGEPPSTIAEVSSDIWDLARSAVAGAMTLVEAEALLPAELVTRRDVLLWVLRNRVRYLLVKAVDEAFPGRLHLRGDDWVRLGFDAQPTSHRRRLRLGDYRRYRVSLDLGSKSTHAWLYPRTAEVMGCAGGLAQFSAAPDDADVPEELRSRRATSASGLVEIVSHMLERGSEEIVRENSAIQAWYANCRHETGRTFSEMIVRSLSAATEPRG